MIGERVSCEVCTEQTIRQCTICSRWVCNRCKGLCPCLSRYVAAGRDHERVAHVWLPSQDVKGQLPCGAEVKYLFSLRVDTAPEIGAARCPVCFAGGPMPGFDPDAGWGAKQTTVAAPAALYPDPKASQANAAKRRQRYEGRARHQPGADATAADYIETETHKVTPEQVLFDDAVVGLPIAEKRIADLVRAIAETEASLATHETQMGTTTGKAHQTAEAKARYCEYHLENIRPKLVEERAAYTAYVAVLLAADVA